jgi:Carboxypeptidase regulatory-like domain
VNNFFPKLGSAFVLCVVVGAASARAVTVTSVSGVVSDSHGAPQVGALVELLRGDSNVVASVFTDGAGRYTISHVQPGMYGLKAVGAAFLPSWRKNLTVKSHTVVNMTLTTVFEAAQWLPVQRKGANESDDDWTWTLRSASNRPLLRMLEDGPILIMTDGAGKPPQPIKARLTSTTSSRQFGKSALHNTFEIGHASPDDKRAMVLRGDYSQGGNSSFQGSAGYRQDLTPDQTLRTIVAVSDHPGIRGTDSQTRLSTLVMRSSEVLRLMDNLQAEAGSELDAVRSDNSQVGSHPFASITWQSGHQQVSYRFATLRNFTRAQDASSGDAGILPQLAEHQGTLTIEHGLHQEIGVTRNMNRGGIEVRIYKDRIVNPVVNGSGNLSEEVLNSGDVLYDSANSLFRISGINYDSTGVLLNARYRLGADTWIAFDLAEGDALAFSSDGKPISLEEAAKEIHASRSQMYAVALNGKVASTGTRWGASYRWQPEETVTAVAAFNGDIISPYLTLYIRQPLRCGRVLPGGIQAQVDLNNLLGEGYRSFKNADGNTLYFAQAERSIQGGLSFTF